MGRTKLYSDKQKGGVWKGLILIIILLAIGFIAYKSITKTHKEKYWSSKWTLEDIKNLIKAGKQITVNIKVNDLNDEWFKNPHPSGPWIYSATLVVLEDKKGLKKVIKDRYNRVPYYISTPPEYIFDWKEMLET